MRKIVLTFGLIAGGILSGMMLITVPFQEQIGFDKGAIIGYTTMVLAFLMVFFGVKSYRDNVAGGNMTFGRALKVGLMITAVASLCYVATWELIYYEFVPDFVDKYAAHAVEKAKQAGATDAELAARTKEMVAFKEMYRNPLVNIALTLLEPLPVGILFALLAAGALSRKRRGESAPVARPEATPV
jgi:amino acid transporter